MLGCAPSVIDENKVIQKIDSLDMTIFSKSGDKIYSITSPNSSYDNIELKFELKKPIIKILNEKQTKYIISSEVSTLSWRIARSCWSLREELLLLAGSPAQGQPPGSSSARPLHLFCRRSARSRS